MTQSNFEYLDDELIDEELKCAICYRTLSSPVCNSQCGHTFCQECIQIWHQNSSICPTCRQNVNIKSYRPVTTRVVLNKLSHLRNKCHLCEQINIEDRKMHLEICQKQIIKCTSADITCQWTGKREELDLHLKTCPLQQVRPILDHVIEQIKTIRENQFEQQRFIEAFINNGFTLSHICPINPCYFDRPHMENKPHLMPCSLCNRQTHPTETTLHSCVTLTCICKSCLEKYTQKSSRLTLKRKLSLSEQSNHEQDISAYLPWDE